MGAYDQNNHYRVGSLVRSMHAIYPFQGSRDTVLEVHDQAGEIVQKRENQLRHIPQFTPFKFLGVIYLLKDSWVRVLEFQNSAGKVLRTMCIGVGTRKQLKHIPRFTSFKFLRIWSWRSMIRLMKLCAKCIEIGVGIRESVETYPAICFLQNFRSRVLKGSMLVRRKMTFIL